MFVSWFLSARRLCRNPFSVLMFHKCYFVVFGHNLFSSMVPQSVFRNFVSVIVFVGRSREAEFRGVFGAELGWGTGIGRAWEWRGQVRTCGCGCG